MTEKFIFTSKARNTMLAVSAIGLVLVIIGIFVHAHQGTRLWANFLLSNFYFAAISVTAVMWIAINYIANAGWSVAFKRIPEAISGYIPIAGISMLILIIATFVDHHGGMNAIYHWMHLDAQGFLHHPNGEKEFDQVLLGKRPYLNVTFWIIRFALYFVLWYVFRQAFRRLSLREDTEINLRNYNSSVKLAAGFLPVFGLTFCFACYDWLMSIDPHWYSTIYAVNIFAGALVTTVTITALIAHLLKNAGYMSYMNDSHFHDLGKWMFGFSIFWTYTWVSQFLLIWYANVPEETPYYFVRMHGNWQFVFFGNFIINFIVPFLALMTRDAKRSRNYLITIAIIMLVGRYIDWYLLIMPGSAGDQSGFGLYELGFFMLYAGIFAFVTATQLAKANLVPVNHPYLEESLHHEI